MDKNNKIAKAFQDLSDEIGGMAEVAEELKELKDTIVDSNEELIATFVEGTKRILKKDSKDISPEIKSLSKSITEGLDSVKKGVAEVERGVKSIKLPSNTDFRATGAMLKLPIKELTRAINDMDINLSTDPKKPIAVRLSDGEQFYKALENVIQQISGGGSTSYAFETSGKSPGKGLIDSDGHVQVDVLTMPGVTIDTTGLATEAKQNTIITHIDGVEGLLTTIDADTGNIATSVASIDTKTPALGQALASASVPVVLTAAQLTTLTPLSTVAVTQSGTWDEVGINDSGNSITIDYNGSAISTSNPLPVQPPASGMFVIGDGTDAVDVLASGADDTANTVNQLVVAGMNYGFDGTAWDRIPGTSVDGLLVNLGANNDVTITGTVTVGSHAVTNAGTFAVQVDGSALTSLQLIDDPVATTASAIPSKGMAISGTDGTNARIIKTDTSGELQVDVLTLPSLPAGTNAIGKLAANSGVDIGDVDITSIAAGTNNIGQVSVAPQTANGLSVFNATSSDGATALTSTAQAIKASAGQLYGWYIYNPNSSAAYVQLYNTAAASVTVGTTNPLFMLTIPATSAANVEFTNGITFSNSGWSCSATSTAGGNGAPTTALDAVFFYK